jgi:AbrB family looped-hinge helix DNA binding protein
MMKRVILAIVTSWRITIPKEYRRQLGWLVGDYLEVTLTDDGQGLVFRRVDDYE